MRKWDKEHGKKEFRNEAIQLALAQGLSVDEVAKKLNEDKTKVRYWARKQGVENEVSQQKDGG